MGFRSWRRSVAAFEIAMPTLYNVACTKASDPLAIVRVQRRVGLVKPAPGPDSELKRAVRGALLLYLAENDLTTESAEERLGFRQQTISKARAGEAGAPFINRILEVIGVAPDVLRERLRSGVYDAVIAEDDARKTARKGAAPPPTPEPAIVSDRTHPTIAAVAKSLGYSEQEAVAASAIVFGLAGTADMTEREALDLLEDVRHARRRQERVLGAASRVEDDDLGGGINSIPKLPPRSGRKGAR